MYMHVWWYKGHGDMCSSLKAWIRCRVHYIMNIKLLVLVTHNWKSIYIILHCTYRSFLWCLIVTIDSFFQTWITIDHDMWQHNQPITPFTKTQSFLVLSTCMMITQTISCFDSSLIHQKFTCQPNIEMVMVIATWW